MKPMRTKHVNLNAEERELIRTIEGSSKAMVNTTRQLCEINSGSYNDLGIKETNQLLNEIFSTTSRDISETPLPDRETVDSSGRVHNQPSQNMLLFKTNPNANTQILCTGHSDTVFQYDSPFQSTHIDGNKLRGPGVADMKGGLVVLHQAVSAIQASNYGERIGITIAISPDEEIGSPSSAALLSNLATQALVGLTYEPSLPDGSFAATRKGSGNFFLTAFGKSAHAGRDFFSGNNAILALSEACLAFEKVSSQNTGVTLNVGVITGGTTTNVVPDCAQTRFNIRVKTERQAKCVTQKIQSILQKIKAARQCEFSLYGHFGRPPKVLNDQHLALQTQLGFCASSLHIPISWKDTGGCCEGNNLTAAGLPNIDTLGVRGQGIHSSQEFAFIDSFEERAKLSALLIARIATFGRDILD